MSYSTTAKLIFGVILDNIFFESDAHTLDQLQDAHAEFTNAELAYDGDGRLDMPIVALSFKSFSKSEDNDPNTLPAGEPSISAERLEEIQTELDMFQARHNITQKLVPAWHLLTYTS